MDGIVVADDSALARMIIIKSLEMLGIDSARIIEASNGQEALVAIKHHSVSLLVTDLNMPKMDGEKLIRWIKASPKLNSISIVVVSSMGNPAKERQLKELGVDYVLNKPVKLVELKKVICPDYAEDTKYSTC